MASLGGGYLGEVPFLLQPPEFEIEKVPLQNTINIGTDDEPLSAKRKAYLPLINAMNKELIAHAIIEFKDAMAPTRLNLDDDQRFSYFRELLTATFRSTWDSLAADNPQNEGGFLLTLDEFVQHYFSETDFDDEKQYLSTLKKPRQMSVDAVSERLTQINIYMSLLNNDVNAYEPNDLKKLFFNIMPEMWRNRYFLNGFQLNPVSVKMPTVVRFMKIQEAYGNKRSAADDMGPAGGGKRAKGRGGRFNRQGGNQFGYNNNNNNRTNNGGGGRGNNNGGGRGNGRGGRGNNNRGGRGGRGGNHTQRNASTCPYHPDNNHTWEQCWGNKNGPNYRPGYVLPTPGSNNNNNNNSYNNNNNYNARNNNRNNGYNNNRNNNGGGSDAHVHAPPPAAAAPNNNSNNASTDGMAVHWMNDLLPLPPPAPTNPPGPTPHTHFRD